MDSSHKLEEYYNKYWSNPAFDSGEPFGDEKDRVESIFQLIDKHVVPSMGAKKNLKILDLGCGRGWLTNLLVHYGNVLGIDPVKAAIERARELFPAICFEVGTAEDLLSAHGPGKFQLIVSSEVIEHVEDNHKKGFMESIYSLLVPGGFAILTTPRAELWDAYWSNHRIKQPIEQWLSESEFEKLSYSVGFKIKVKNKVFGARIAHNLISRIATSDYYNMIMKKLDWLDYLKRVRKHYAVYQIILLKRSK